MPIIFYPDDLKITHIKRCDNSIYRINFKVKENSDSKNDKYAYSTYSIQEELGNSSIKTLSKLENNHWKIEAKVNDNGKKLSVSCIDEKQKSRIMQMIVSKSRRKDYEQKKKLYLKTIRTIPYSQLDMEDFAKLLNYFFSYESERSRYLNKVKNSLESSVSSITELCKGLKEYKASAAVNDLLSITESLKNVIENKANWEAEK